MIQRALAELLEGRDLSQEDAREVMRSIMGGEATPGQIGGFLVALRLKGETADEIAGCAEAMREHVLVVEPERSDLVDTAGTGGDGARTFNISTAAALVAAAAGAGVAKHGNRAVSSSSGSADVLEALGFNLELAPELIARSIDELGFGFLFAPTHHPAMRHAAPIRRELAARTVFNVLGPLTNPAGARAQVVGVYAPELVPTIAEVLARLGAERAFVVHGAAGVDELSPAGPNLVCEVVDGTVRQARDRPARARDRPLCAGRAPRRRAGGERRDDPGDLCGRSRREARRGVAERGRCDRRGRPGEGSRGGRRTRARGGRLRCGRRAARRADRLLEELGGRGMRFRDALAGPGLAGIAEIKRRSPSAGDLRPDAEPAALARDFERSGAAAISVLVDERFAGSPADLRAARAATSLPLLAKGFFREAGQLAELRRDGADAVLLLLRDLDDDRAAALMTAARELGLDALVEAHDGTELDRAVQLGADPIGVNARDLGTFEIDRQAQLELVARAPRDRVVIAESGIESRAQAAAAELAGAAAVLVGSTLMRAPDPGAKLRELLARPLVKICGLTREEDVAAASEAGADLAGFILARESPRRADAVLPVPETMLSVAVFVGERADAGSDLVQLYEREDGHRGRDAVLLRGDEQVGRVLDLPWEEPDPDHHARAAGHDGRVVLAGKLAPENVRAAIAAVRPWAVDASSQLEVEPGIKDPERIRAFVEAVRS